MNEMLSGFGLLIVVIWPALIILPSLRMNLRRPLYLAIAPAALLALSPGQPTVGLPWILFEAALALDASSRIILVMCVLSWGIAAAVPISVSEDSARARLTIFSLLALSGNLVAILAADPVVFLSGSTLMGYSFYGVLVEHCDDARGAAARWYLVFLVAADLLLFEALILLAQATDPLRFDLLGGALAQSPSELYLWVVVAGFGLKAGVWPFHLWLSATLSDVRGSGTLLIGSVPVAMALVGASRWLPLGELSAPGPGSVLRIIGIAGFLYAGLMYFKHARVNALLTWGTLAATGLFVAFIGSTLMDPAVWRAYEPVAYLFIASFGVVFTITTIVARRAGAASELSPGPRLSEIWSQRFLERLDGIRRHWATQGNRILNVASSRRHALRDPATRLTSLLDAGERRLSNWTVALTLLVLLAITVSLTGLS